jgi:hypothetical protein
VERGNTVKIGKYPIRKISQGDRPAIHSYYDICPEDFAAKRVLYSRFDGQPPCAGEIVVATIDGSHHDVVAQVPDVGAHSGVNQSWAGADRIVFRCDGWRENMISVLDVKTGSVRSMPHGIRQISPVHLLGLSTGSSPFEPDGLIGVFELDIAADTTRSVLTCEEAIAVHPRRGEFQQPELFRFQNSKWSHDGERFLVMLSNAWAGDQRSDPYIHAAIVAERGGANPRFVADIGHHPMWGADDSFIYYYLSKPATQTHDLVKHPLVGDGVGDPEILSVDHPGVHATLSHDGRSVLSDAHRWPASKDGVGFAAILLSDLVTGEHEVLASFANADYEHATGCHPHPVWSRDGKRIYFNAAESGVPYLYVIDLEA